MKIKVHSTILNAATIVDQSQRTVDRQVQNLGHWSKFGKCVFG
jgi:hypothetical protein